LGDFDKAQPKLDEYVKAYPKGKFIMHAEYYQASNWLRLQEVDKAAKLLDAFLAKYPEPEKNIYMSNALFDRASCHFSANEYDPALSIIEQLQSKFPESVVIEMALNMKGNIFESTDKMKEAEQCYIDAFALAKKRGNRSVAGEALSYLVGMLCVEDGKKANPRVLEAVQYYDLL